MSRDESGVDGRATEPTAQSGTSLEDTPPPVRRALSMSMLNTALSKVGGFATGIILARILVPEEFGVYAVAFVALNAVLSFNELGVSLAIVRWKGDHGRSHLRSPRSRSCPAPSSTQVAGWERRSSPN